MEFFEKVGIIVVTLIFFFGSFCIYDVIRMLNLSSKVIGYFQHTTDVVKVNDFEYDITQLLFTNSGANENEYFAEVKTSPVEGFDKTKKYTFEVNGNKCGYVDKSLEYVNANYINTFYSTNDTVLLTDSLNIKINFYKDGTKIVLITNNGEKAVKLWSSYIQKNGFKIKIVEDNFNSVIEADNIPSYTANLYLEEQFIKSIEFNCITSADLPETFGEFIITSWKDKDGNEYSKDRMPNKNIDLYANLSKSTAKFEINNSNLLRCMTNLDDGATYSARYIINSYNPKCNSFYDPLFQTPRSGFSYGLTIENFYGNELNFSSFSSGNFGSSNLSGGMKILYYDVSSTIDNVKISFKFILEKKTVDLVDVITPYIDISIGEGEAVNPKYSTLLENAKKTLMDFSATLKISQIN